MMIVLIILILLFIITGFITGNFLFNLALNPKSSKSMIFNGEIDEEKELMKIENEKWLSENAKDVYISNKKLNLHSYEVKSKKESKIWIIAVHGYTDSAYFMVNSAKIFLSYGYNVLIPDLRAHGKSEGKYIGMGWLDKDDIRLWIDWIIDRDPEAEIVLHGISMGAATVMMVSGLDLPDNVKAAVEDCGYTSVWDIFADELKALFHLPPFPVMNMYSVMSRIITGYTPKEASSLDMLSESEIPMLFIHGDDDHFVGTYMLDICFDAKRNGDKEKLLVPDAGHGEAYLREPELYFNTVHEFISRYVK